MPKRSVLYIGNKGLGATPTTIDLLGIALASEGYRVITASDKRSKILRLLHMCLVTLLKAKGTGLVLIDTYSTQNFYYAVIVARLCKMLNVPYIPILHGGNLPQRFKRNPRLSRRLFGKAKVNVSPSSYLMAAFKEAGYDNMEHIPNSINLELYPFKQREEVRAKLLWVRSFHTTYNPKLALDVVMELNRKGVEATLTMVGPDKDGSLESCKKLAKEEGLPVAFTGKLEKEQWIRLAKDHDLFINTTNYDNMPVTVIEAMALGLPVVSTSVGGLPYLIDHEEDGLLVPPADAAAFVDAIARLLDEPELVARLTLNARIKVEQFGWELVKQQWMRLLDV